MKWPPDATHVLTVAVPLRVDVDAEFDPNPLEEALRAIMPITRLASTGAICGDRATPPLLQEGHA